MMKKQSSNIIQNRNFVGMIIILVMFLAFMYISLKSNVKLVVASNEDTYSNVYENTSKKSDFEIELLNEVEEQIKKFDKVKDANIFLNISNESKSLGDNIQMNASVGLVLSEELAEHEALAVARIVAMSIDGMEIEDIEISNQNSEIIYSNKDI